MNGSLSTEHAHNGRRRRNNLCFTIDVLTDGSEYTGNGTLFLSVWKRPLTSAAASTASSSTSTAWLEEVSSFSPPLARYAIAGLGDATARLCADQRFKLANTKAVFLPSLECADGLPALLLALHTGGAPNLHVAGPDGAFVERMATLILGPKRHSQIQNCQVPEIPPVPRNVNGDDKGENSISITWFSVYQDEFLTVHATRNPSDSSQLFFLFSLFHMENSVQTIALLPPQTDAPFVYNRFLTSNLPILEGHPSSPQSVVVDCLLMLRPTTTTTSNLSALPIPVLATMPSNDIPDPGILMKSRSIAAYLANQRPDTYVSVASVPTTTPCPSTPPASHDPFMILQSCTSIVLPEKPFHFPRSDPTGDQSPRRTHSWLVWDRRRSARVEELSVDPQSWASTIASFPPSSASVQQDSDILNLDDNEIDLEDLDDDEDDEGDTKGEHNHDVNTTSIPTSLPSSDSASPSYRHHPQLLVLGTGCATPSAIRGASGYAISLRGAKRDLMFVDAGEGIACMMSRYSAWHPTWYDHVAGIWISHAHLDHYGGLPTLLRTIVKQMSDSKTPPTDTSMTFSATTKDTNPPPAKRPRWTSATTSSTTPNNSNNNKVCWVMAPPKVLEFLDIMLQCRHGIHVSTGEPWFVPLRHQDRIPLTFLSTTSGTSIHLQSFPVQHNCWPAYGFILGWPRKEEDENDMAAEDSTTRYYCREVGKGKDAPAFLDWLCYSGDTRPCPSLIRACQQVHVPDKTNQSKLVLLHEATFDQDDLALRKKHSTIQEAVEVAATCGATRLVLTHFSPRTDCNDSNNNLNNNNNDHNNASLYKSKQHANNKNYLNNTMEVGWAMDGMQMEL